ncbi:hypothetical protein TRFO_23939 [Tritrichomonas foetus]|uniref:Uncharacterized protein n=1 Tax=Tritrichomonas foetus TaxID=1144522 RepID=A0A1J4K8C7_9EUKA|nr:hypothetical protein TRFO_23939 [Tritrichomonas foetus]|eukprot:OHT07753.1 hypothetical protein TRFO_23939 [Tritrichomonas foetus]
MKCGTVSFLSKPETICEKRIESIRKELGLDEDHKVLSDEEQKDFSESCRATLKEKEEKKIENKMKENLGFAELVAAPLFRTTSKLINEMKEQADRCEKNLTKWKHTLFPPMENENESIVIR